MWSVYVDVYVCIRVSVLCVYWFEVDYWLDGLYVNYVIEFGGVGVWWC